MSLPSSSQPSGSLKTDVTSDILSDYCNAVANPIAGYEPNKRQGALAREQVARFPTDADLNHQDPPQPAARRRVGPRPRLGYCWQKAWR